MSRAIKTIQTLGVASCIGGSTSTCDTAPLVIQNSPYLSLVDVKHIELNWHDTIYPDSSQQDLITCLQQETLRIAQFTRHQINTQQNFLIVGGDHSCAIGSWAGVIDSLADDKRFALLWIDAHMDSHTLDTSPSGNLHGMPISPILGRADRRLSSAYPATKHLDGKDLFLFGVRSFETAEQQLLNQVDANVFTMQDIHQLGGTQAALQQVITRIDSQYDCFGISLDLDAIDPKDAPAVETQVSDGLQGQDMIDAFSNIANHEKLLGFEICEFNPANDINQRTEKLLIQLIAAIYGR